MSPAKYLIQDIETVPESEIASMWDPTTDPQNDRHPGREPFPPIWAHKVACIGMLVLDEHYMPVKSGCAAGGLSGGKSEKEMLERWSEVASGALFDSHRPSPLKMVDYNGRGFDVPVMQTRCFRYGIQLPWYLGLQLDNKGQISQWSKAYRDRYAGMHLDVQDLWTNHGAFRYPHLENLARLIGLPGKVGIDGSKVYEAYKEKRFAEIDTYCQQDVAQTAFVFIRFRYMAGDLFLDQYRAACEALIAHLAKLPEHAGFVEKIDRAALLLEQ